MKYTYNYNFFKEDNEQSFYVAGFLAADGYVNKKQTNVTLALAIKDKEHLIKIRNLICDSKIHYYRQKEMYDSCRFTIHSKEITNDLFRFGIGNKKSQTYSMPSWMMSHPMTHHFLRGYVDGDGCWCILTKKLKTPRATFKLEGTLKFLNDFNELTINKNKKISLRNGIYHLDYGGNIICAKIAKYLYTTDASIFLERKKDIVSKIYANERKCPSKQDIEEMITKLGKRYLVAKELGYSTGRISQLCKIYNI